MLPPPSSTPLHLPLRVDIEAKQPTNESHTRQVKGKRLVIDQQLPFRLLPQISAFFCEDSSFFSRGHPHLITLMTWDQSPQFWAFSNRNWDWYVKKTCLLMIECFGFTFYGYSNQLLIRARGSKREARRSSFYSDSIDLLFRSNERWKNLEQLEKGKRWMNLLNSTLARLLKD